MVRSMSEAIDLYDEGKGILPVKSCKKPCWTQKTKSFHTTSFPMSPSAMTTAVPTQQKAKKAVPLSGKRSNAAPSEATAGWIIQKGGARPLTFGR